jgi:hypothetical protein
MMEWNGTSDGSTLPDLLASGLAEASHCTGHHLKQQPLGCQVLEPEDWLNLLGVQKLLPGGSGGKVNLQVQQYFVNYIPNTKFR